MKLFSPAKINLYLRVLRRRPDGYHDLETLFERVSLGDEIVLKEAPSKIRLQCSLPSLPEDSRNLAYRAAELVKKQFKVKKGVTIFLKKRIPVSAGLGGGSSNAATVLLGLNRLWKLRLGRKELLNLAATLGSDVPFFVLDTPFALGTGRGEILRKVGGIKAKLWHCLVKPAFGISTKEAYQGLNLSSLTPPQANAKMLLHSIQKGDLTRVSMLLLNSLELSINNRVTTIFKIKKKLAQNGAFGSLMSGSGSSVFGIFRSKRAAARAARILKKENKSWQVFVVSTY